MTRIQKGALAAGVALVFSGGSALAVPTLVTSFVFNDSGPGLENDASLYPTTLDGAQTLYSWGLPGGPNNSSRTVTYGGTDTFTFSYLMFTGTAFLNSELSVPETYGEDLGIRLYLNAQNDADTIAPNLTFPDYPLENRGNGGTDISDPTVQPSFGSITSRIVNPGTVFTFDFFENFKDGPDSVPDATYDTDFTIQVWGEVQAANPSLSVDPLSVDFGNVRVGTTSAGETVTATNDGDPGSTLSNVVLGASPGDFNGGPSSPADLGQGDSTSQDYTYQPGEIGADTEAVTVSADSVPSQDVTLSGNGVGPVFDLLGYGTGGTIDLGSVDISDPAVVQNLTLQNIFGTDLGDALTDLTILNVGLTDTNGFFGLGGLPGTPFAIDADGGSQAFSISFDPTAVGTWGATLTFGTDVGQALGVAGQTYTFDLRGTGTSAGGEPVPLPATLLLMGLGLAGIGASRFRKAA